MQAFQLTNRAQADLKKIAAYTLKPWGFNQTVKYLAEMHACFSRIAEDPMLGQSFEIAGAGRRRIVQGRHIISYRQAEGGVIISRILHQQMLPRK